MIGDNGNAPDHTQDGHQLISAAQPTVQKCHRQIVKPYFGPCLRS